jgi:acetyl esterase
MTGPNTGLGHNSMIVMIEGQARYARDAIRTMRERGARTIEPKPEAEAAFNRWIGARTGNTVWASGCKSWYLDEQGRNTTLWPGFASTFRARLARFDDADLELGSAPPRPGVRDRAEVRLARALARLPDPVKRGLAGGKPIRIDGDTLLPEIQLTLAVRAKIGAPDYRALGVERARRQFRRDTILHRGELEEVALVRSLEVDGAAGALEARLFSPAEDVVLPLLVYFHGGGFTLGDLDSHEPVCRLLAARGDMHVLSVAYRLAPEHRFPAAVDDACAAYRWAVENARALGSDPALVGVGGDSAGANLSAVLSLAMRDASGPRPALQLLVYPPTDRVEKWPSLDRLAQGFLLTSSEIAWFNEQYIPDADRSDPRISPLRATDHANLPPALVVTAAFDPLRDEGEAYAARLREAGTPVTLRRVAGQVHGFVNLVGVSESSRRTVIEIARDTREMFDRVARRPDVSARESLAAGG